ncbi:MAG: CHAT domain-containing protein, partial [bacterium]|nr:CHAT domain-containing protein [bacterium]
KLGSHRTLCGELVGAGIPEIISHLWPISDGQAYRLATRFYDAYLRSPSDGTTHEFDAALALLRARQAMEETSEAIWGAPVLVSQGPAVRRRLPELTERLHG